jgi:hypothetical protein
MVWEKRPGMRPWQRYVNGKVQFLMRFMSRIKSDWRALRQRGIFAAVVFGVGLNVWPLPANPLRAQEAAVAETEEEDDQETARKALEAKEILPLSVVLARIEETFAGDVLEIELERKRGAWVYEIEIIDALGRVRDIDVDGKTGEVITIEFDK